MIQTFYALYPHDTVNETFVLRHICDGKLVVRQEYSDLVCSTCKKVDEKAALERGIQPNVVVTSKRPFLGSSDDFYLVNEAGKQIFSHLLPDELNYYLIPSSRFFVVTAKLWHLPMPIERGYRFVNRACQRCGRPKEVVWGMEPAQIESPMRFLAINLESRMGARETWIVSKEIATELEKLTPRLTGIVISPKEFDVLHGS